MSQIPNFLLSLQLSQRTVYHLGYLRLGILFFHSVGNTSIYIRYLKSLYTIMCNISHKVYVVYIKLTVFLPLGIHLTEKFYLCIVEVTAYFLNHPDVTEELCTQITIAHYSLTNHTQMGIDKLYNLILRTYATGGYLIEFVAQALKLAFNNGIVDFLLGFKIGI